VAAFVPHLEHDYGLMINICTIPPVSFSEINCVNSPSLLRKFAGLQLWGTSKERGEPEIIAILESIMESTSRDQSLRAEC
jgi:hypothetical protein